MVCIYCGNETNIINSRHLVRGNQTWRRHRCSKCQITFTTLENCQLENTLLVATAGDNKLPFLRDGLFLSIYQALPGTDKNTVNIASHLTQTIINNLLKPKPLKPLIDISDIYAAASRVLKRYDSATAIRYASLRVAMPTTNDVKRFLRN